MITTDPRDQRRHSHCELKASSENTELDISYKNMKSTAVVML
jgi:hypothetical protein